jgi:hypothetical protein
MNKIEENNNENISEGNTSNSDTQDFISSSDDEIKSSAHQKFNVEFLGCNINENGSSVLKPQTGFASKREKRTRNRPSKAERFVEEREELIKELEKKMGLTEEVRGVLLYDLEHNEELKEYLKNKIPEIRKLYKCGTWNYFVKQHIKEGEEPSEIGLMKSIFKSEKFELVSKMKYAEREGERKKYSHIYFLKDLNLNQYFK